MKNFFIISPFYYIHIIFDILTKYFYILTIIFSYTDIVKGDDIIELKIVGSNCSNGMRLKKIIKRVIDENKIKININELNTNSDIKKYNIRMIPAIVIDNKIISQGKILSDREIKKLIVNTMEV